MGSTRAGGSGAEAGWFAEPDLLAAAGSLRWARPDLTEAVARHVLELAAADDDHRCWLEAAGWLVCARSATGDARVVATEVLDGLARWGDKPMADPAAHRLRVELAALAAAAGEVPIARLLLVPVMAGGVGAELRGEAYCVLARCSADDRPGEVGDGLLHASTAWAELDGPRGGVGSATVALVAAAVERRAGRASDAIAHAVDGLAQLDHERDGRAGVPSEHVAAALATEWISALLDAGRPTDALAGCESLGPQLTGATRPTRQSARLRLTVARAVAADPDRAAEALEQASRDATVCDSPDLEAVCRSALGSLHDQAGRVEAAVDSIQRGVSAQRRNLSRDARFMAALRAAMAPDPLAVATGLLNPWSIPDHDSAAGPGNGGGQPVQFGSANGSTDRDPAHRDGSQDSASGRPVTIVDAVSGIHTPDGLTSDGAVPTPPAARGESIGRHCGSAGPWSTGRWTAAEPSSSDAPIGRSSAAVGRENGGAGPSRPGAGHECAEPTHAADPDGWLQAALAELDRTLGRPEAEQPIESPPASTGSRGGAGEQCVVVIDVARSGRRFAGRRAGAVVQAVAARLADRLPAGAHVRDEHAEALSVVLPGWGRSSATEWMHHILPGILDGFAVVDEVPGAHLRATVHDPDGPVGAQILQRIGQLPGGRAAASPAAARGNSGDDPPPGRGRHEAAGRTPFHLDGQAVRPGSGGRRYRRGSDGYTPAAALTSTAGASTEPAGSRTSVGPMSTDGLGIADLLAGALAAYRGI